MKRMFYSALIFIGLVGQLACAGNRAPVLVGQSGLAIAQSIGVLQVQVKAATDQKVLTVQQALPVQQGLLSINERLKPLPDLLRLIEKLQAADQSPVSQIDQAIAILSIVGQDLSVVVAGVPIGDATKAMIDLVRQSQQLVQSTLVAIAQLRAE